MLPPAEGERPLRSRVGAEGRGLSLDGYLAQRFRYHDLAQWRAEIRAGRVLVGGEAATAERRLRAGDEVTWLRRVTEPWVDDRILVLHEDDDVLAVAKPAHLPMHADGPFVRSTLVQLLRDRRNEPELGLVHRLDRETSGVALLARTVAARKALQAQFEAGAVTKRYVAVVVGEPPQAWSVAAPIGHARGSEVSLRRSCADDAVEPKAACTRFTRLAVGAGHSLVQAEPETGRTHQIRVHLAHSGHPIVGDKIYGQPDARYLAFVAAVKASGDPRAVPGFHPNRHLLHAAGLTVRHPRHGGLLPLESAMPAEFAAWLAERPPAAD